MLPVSFADLEEKETNATLGKCLLSEMKDYSVMFREELSAIFWIYQMNWFVWLKHISS
jgi:hypothetical protein